MRGSHTQNISFVRNESAELAGNSSTIFVLHSVSIMLMSHKDGVPTVLLEKMLIDSWSRWFSRSRRRSCSWMLYNYEHR